LLYAASKAIGPRLLNDEEAKETARRAYRKNPKLSLKEISKAVGRSRQSVDSYISELRANIQEALNLKIFRMNYLGIPQDRISSRLGIA
jgi:hypothetical protein